MNFFQYFQRVPYEFVVGNTAFTLVLTNLTQHIRVLERIKNTITVFYDYVIQDGDRPDTVALKVYKSVEYTWLILLVNGIMSLYDWPLTTTEFNEYIVDKYGSIPAALSAVQYYTAAGHVVDVTTYGLLSSDDRGTTISLYDVELATNEAKRRIKLVPPALAGPLTLELKKALAE
jgi:hypothetical protein